MSRREFSAKVRAQAFERSKGHCEKCTALLFVGKYRYDHVIPDQLGGDPTLENCQVICLACDKPKTASDQGNIAKAKRRQNKHIGIKKKSRFPGAKDSIYKRKMNGTVVRRDGK